MHGEPLAVTVHRAIREAIAQDYAGRLESPGTYDLTGRVVAGQHLDPPCEAPCVAVGFPTVVSDPGTSPIGRYTHQAEYLIQGWVAAGPSLEERGEAAIRLYSDVLSGLMEHRYTPGGRLHRIKGLRNLRFTLQILQGDATDIPGMPGFAGVVTAELDTERGI